MKSFGKRIAVWAIALLPVLIALFAYPHLPEQIPLSWGFDGDVSCGARWSILPLSAAGVLITALAPVFRRIDPKKSNYDRFSGAYSSFILLFDVFILCMTLLTLTEAFRPGTLPVETFVLAAVGVLITVCGNLMPKFKHNYFIGVRTPWTLASETVWYRTHRLCGMLWVIGGILLIVGAFLPSPFSYWLVLADCVLICVVPIAASYWYFKKEQS